MIKVESAFDERIEDICAEIQKAERQMRELGNSLHEAEVSRYQDIFEYAKYIPIPLDKDKYGNMFMRKMDRVEYMLADGSASTIIRGDYDDLMFDEKGNLFYRAGNGDTLMVNGRGMYEYIHDNVIEVRNIVGIILAEGKIDKKEER